MEFILTCKVKHSVKCKDKKRRNFLLYFINGVLILKQKYPFNEQYDYGFQYRTDICDEYILNGKMYQTRSEDRQCVYPISKKVLAKLNIPDDLKITIS